MYAAWLYVLVACLRQGTHHTNANSEVAALLVRCRTSVLTEPLLLPTPSRTPSAWQTTVLVAARHTRAAQNCPANNSRDSTLLASPFGTGFYSQPFLQPTCAVPDTSCACCRVCTIYVANRTYECHVQRLARSSSSQVRLDSGSPTATVAPPYVLFALKAWRLACETHGSCFGDTWVVRGGSEARHLQLHHLRQAVGAGRGGGLHHGAVGRAAGERAASLEHACTRQPGSATCQLPAATCPLAPRRSACSTCC